jgi:predicted naringenin-chalcone synthase
MVTAIVGIGKCAPSFKLTQDEAFQSAQMYCGGSEKQKRALRHLYGRSTIKTRGVVRDNMVPLFAIDEAPSNGLIETFFSPPRTISDLGPTTGERMIRYEREVASLATEACVSAFDDMRRHVTSAEQRTLNPSDISALVTVSCTGFYSPGFDIELVNRLKLNRGIARTHVGFMGCHGALNGLRIADALSKSSSSNGYVLLCAAEICSIHFHYGWNSDNLLANSLFADGAASLLLAPSQGPENWCLVNSASHVVPDSLDAMSWKVQDDGFAMTLSSAVPALIQSHLRSWLENWLSSLGLTFADIEAWAIHPGGAKIVEAVRQSLDLPESAVSHSLGVLQEFGNMSSPTVLFILEKIRESLGCVPTVVLAFGPGLTIEAAYLSPAKE